ncbi:MAG: hypothetical protein ACRDM3_05995 [Rubrobacteraceae bacterium]
MGRRSGSRRAIRHILVPEVRHDFYRTLRIVVHAHLEGSVEVTGEVLPFDAPGSPPGRLRD